MIKIKHSNFEAIILKQGAQLVSFNLNGQEYLWSTEFKYYQKNIPFRGGIPICWPWFGKYDKLNHGFARIIDWNLINTTYLSKEVIISFELVYNEDTLKMWNHKFKLTLDINLSDDGIKLLLNIKTDISTSGAFHTYYNTEDISKSYITGLNKDYKNLINNNLMYNSPKDLYINGELDRIYTNSNDEVKLYSINSITTINNYNHGDIVVWNPGIEKSKQMTDIKNGEYKKFVCIETARITKKFKNNDFIKLEIYKENK